MLISLLFFLVAGGLIAIIDYKKNIIPDILSIPSILIMFAIKLYENGTIVNEIKMMVLVLFIFVLLIYFFNDFGGGDLRFGALCAVFIGSIDIFLFFIVSGIVQAFALSVSGKKVIGFAPAMFIGALTAKLFGAQIWSLL